MRILTEKDFIVMPWKNGQGTTTELFRIGSDLRISQAQVAGSCSFSLFPDCDRVLMQLSGNPMTLTHEGGTKKTLKLFEPYGFDGAVSTECALDGKASDFNVFFKKGIYTASLNYFLMESGQKFSVSQTKNAFVYILSGNVQVGAFRLQAHEALFNSPSAEAIPLFLTSDAAQIVVLIFS